MLSKIIHLGIQFSIRSLTSHGGQFLLVKTMFTDLQKRHHRLLISKEKLQFQNYLPNIPLMCRVKLFDITSCCTACIC